MHDTSELRQSYRNAFAGEAGRAVLADLETRAFVRETSFHPDPQRASFQEGRRSLVLHVRRMLDQEPTGCGGGSPATPRAHKKRGGPEGPPLEWTCARP